MSGQIKRCASCDAEFLKNRTDRIACSRKCSAKLSYRKTRKALKQKKDKVKIKSHYNQKIYDEVTVFIFKIKRQSFRADAIDIFRLLDLFDKVFPLIKSVPSCSNIDKAANIMFFRIVNWWRIVNDKAPMPTPDFKSIK